MFDPRAVIAVITLYVGILFLIAQWAERRSAAGRSMVTNPVVYSLSLAVYCTAWTYYGSVGVAATSGMLFLPIYLGPTMAAALWWIILRKLVRIKSRYHITSIADFISARYDKSHGLAAMVTLIAGLGVMPYIALQLKAIISSFAVISSPAVTAVSASSLACEEISWIGRHIGPVVVVFMILFTIMFGARRLDPTERHEGMVMALAVECVVKLGAFLAAGVFVVYSLYGGFGDLFLRVASSPYRTLASLGAPPGPSSFTWASYTLLAMSAILFLPRQFHVAVVENSDERHIPSAMWLFPLYMLLINIFVFPIATGGLLGGRPASEADTYVLSLPLDHGRPMLALFVFLGGFSAATGMIMISSMTMATMITNHLLLPVLDWAPPWLGFLRRRLLHCRWAAVAYVILIGYWFERQVGHSTMLANIGLISFGAVLQFAPAMLGGIFWERGNRVGAMLGMGTGFIVWLYTMLVPAFVKSGWIGSSLLEEGPFGVSALRPEHLLGIGGLDPVSHTVFWSMFFNVGLYLIGSLLAKTGEREQRQAKEFTGILQASRAVRGPERHPYEANIDLETKRRQIEDLLGQYLGPLESAAMVDRCLKSLGLEEKMRISIEELAELHGEAEKVLAGSIGSAAAHKALNRGALFTTREASDLAKVYSRILVGLKVTPEELRRKVDFYQERAELVSNYARELESEVARRARELESAHEELVKREKLAVLGRLTATVSHELRNPLGVIRSSAFFLQRRLKDQDEKTVKHLNRIEEQVSLCDSIVGDLLEYTRGRRSEAIPGEINPWLSDLIDELSIPEHVALSVHLDSGAPVVCFDRDKLRRVLINLVDNAIHAVNGRREALKEADALYEPRIRVSTAAVEKGLSIEVEDNGTGMESHIASRAFEPLYTTRARGTGLGLAIVRKIIEEHEGRVELESEPNCRTVVRCILPE